MSGRDTLLEAFLASATDRLVSMGEAVASVGETSDPELIRRLGRDFHTLKGESRLVGLEAIERLAHAAEDVLFSHQRANRFGIETQEHLYEAIDTIFECVQAASAGHSPSDDEIAAVLAKLKLGVVQPEQGVAAQETPNRAPTPTTDEPVEEPAAGRTTVQKPSSAVGATDDRGVRLRGATLERIGELVAAVSGGLVRNKEYLAELGKLHDEVGSRLRLADRVSDEAAADLAALHRAQGDVLRRFGEDLFSTGLVDAELSEMVRTSRLRPLSYVFSSYPTHVRRLAAEHGKKIRFDMRGLEARVEQRVADEVAEPCLHLVRNAVAHGIESPEERRAAGKPEMGSISLTAAQEGDLIRVEFVDDGRGMDLERLGRRAVAMGLTSSTALQGMSETQIFDFAFRSGLSTAAEVSELAGRGVGLDVVRDVLERLSGSVKVESQAGVGCKFTLLLPVSVSIMRVLLVDAAEQVFAVPNAAVVEVYWLPVKEIRTDAGHESTFYRGRLLPLARLREALNMRGIRDLFVNKVVVVVIKAGDQSAGFIVDRCLGEREVVARRFGGFLGRPETTAGVTVLEDGSLIVILHPGDLVRASRKEHSRAVGKVTSAAGQAAERRVLYAEDSLITREYAASVLRAHGFDVVEVADGVEALEALEKQSFDLLLTDLQMPRMDGFKLTAAVRREAKHKTLPIVVLSTVDAPETKRMALHAGADAYIVKSQFGVDVLISTLRQVLG